MYISKIRCLAVMAVAICLTFMFAKGSYAVTVVHNPDMSALIDNVEEKDIPRLVELLVPDGTVAAGESKNILIDYGDKSVAALADKLKDPAYHQAVMGTLAEITPTDASLKIIRPLLDSRDGLERSGAAYVLGFWVDAASSRRIEAIFTDPDEVVRKEALEGYTRLYQGDPAGYNHAALLHVLSADPSLDNRKLALEMIRLKPLYDDTETLLGLVDTEKDPKLRYKILIVIGETENRAAIYPLMKLLTESKDERTQDAATYSLGLLHAEEAVPYIVDIVRAKQAAHDNHLSTCFQSLTDIGKPVDMELFIPYLSQEDLDKHVVGELLYMMYACSTPKDAKLIAALEEFKAKTDLEELANRADAILKKIR